MGPSTWNSQLFRYTLSVGSGFLVYWHWAITAHMKTSRTEPANQQAPVPVDSGWGWVPTFQHDLIYKKKKKKIQLAASLAPDILRVTSLT